MNYNFFGNMIIVWFALVIIGIIIFIALIVAIFQMNSNIKSIKDYLLRNEFLESRRLEPQEEWIYETNKKPKSKDDWPDEDKKEVKLTEETGTKESIWKKKIF